MSITSQEYCSIALRVIEEIIHRPPTYFHPVTGQKRCGFCGSQVKSDEQHAKDCPVRVMRMARKMVEDG